MIFLVLIGISITVGFGTIEGEAMSYGSTIPQRTINLEFYNKSGSPITTPMTFDTSFSRGLTTFTSSGTYSLKQQPTFSTIPISSLGGNKYQMIIPGRAIYLVTTPNYPGGNYNANAEADSYFEGFLKLELITDSPLKNISSFTVKGNTVAINTFYNGPTGSGTSSSAVSNYFNGQDITFTKVNDQLFRIQTNSSSHAVSQPLIWRDNSTGYPNQYSTALGYTRAGTVNSSLTFGMGGFYVGVNGSTLKFYANNSRIIEKFETPAGGVITPPTGYIQNKATEMTTSDFTYTMTNSEKLPESYLVGNVMYIYDGWYRGRGNSATRDKTHPVPKITFEASGVESADEVHIVYRNVNTANLIEQIRDRSGNVIESSWDQASRKVPIGEYTNTPDSVKTDTQGRKWEYVGWRVGTTGSIQTGPVSRNLTVNSTTTIQYIYEESKTTGDLSLTIEPEVINNEGDTTLVAILKNTGTSDMKELKMKFSDKWMLTNGSTSGIYSPSSIFVTVEGEAEKKIGTNESNFFNGQPLTDIVIPAGKEARIEIPIRGRGNPLEMLQAGIEISGNLVDDVGNDITLKASNVVRVDDPEAPTIDGDGDAGFINIFKNLNFGTTTYSPSAQTKALDMTSSPYLRFYDMNDLQPQWSLQAKLDAFKTTANKTLPTATSISFKEFQLYDINDYKKITENISANGAAVSEFVLPSDGNTVEVTNRGNKGYYEIKTGPSNVQLNIPAFAGLSGESYSSTLTWTLSTGP